MADRIVTLAEALRGQLATQLDKTVRRRYLPYMTSQEIQLKEERITVYFISDTSTVKTRGYDDNRFEIGVQVAQTLPESGDQTELNPDADLNQLEFLDARMQTVADIKDLFRDDGALREVEIGGCYFMELAHPRLFNSDELMRRLFSSIITLSFMYSDDA